MKLQYDELLDAYFDENNKIIKGRAVVKQHSFNKEYDAIDIIKKEEKGEKESVSKDTQ